MSRSSGGGVRVGAFYAGAAYVGTAIGAGFASGQEILQFFVYFGAMGLPALAISIALLTFTGYAVMEWGRRLRAESFEPVVLQLGGTALGRAVDWITTFFMFGAYATMLAGAGAVFVEQFGWGPAEGNVVMMAVTLLTVLLGLEGMVGSFSVLVPVMALAMGALGAATAASQGSFGALFSGFRWSNPYAAPVPWWPLSAVTYASYNTALTIGVLAPLGSRLGGRQDAVRGAVVGGVGLGIAAVATYTAIAAHMPGAASFEVPMIYAAGYFGPSARLVYSLVLLAAIYTTAISALYGFVSRLTVPQSPVGKAVTVAVAVGGLVASMAGFTHAVRILYPAVGYAGLVLIAFLLVKSP